MSYSALVCKIHTRPHGNASKLQLGNANGYQVVVGLDTEDGQLGVFFGADGQLAERFAQVHDLVSYTDENGERKGGYFAKNRRVRSQKFRGERSDGFWVPLSYFDYLKLPAGTLVEGLTFSELNGEVICQKYYTPATLQALRAGGGKKRYNHYFPEHYDTSQYKHNKRDIPADSIIFFTEKVHGTSQRSGYVLEEVPVKRSWIRRIVDTVLRRPEPTTLEYAELLGTRRVILNHKPEDDTGFYGSHAFRHEMHNKYFAGQMRKGEIFYYEVVGFAGPYQPIMSAQNTVALKDKEISKQYGTEMTYSYGCSPASKMCEVYVYRITNTVPDDRKVIDLSWQQVKKRCRELGVPHVPEVCESVKYRADQPWRLDNVVDATCEGESTLDSRHIREGVCLRIESGERDPYVLKAKSFTFGVLEGYLKEAEEFVDLEEVS